MKRTALFEEHVKLGGRMVDFAGWELPVMYASIVEEHTAVRERAGLFDVSHMGEVLVRGPRAADFLARLIPTRLDKITPGKSMYSCFMNERGGVIDDLFVYMVSGEEYFLVINASTTEKDLAWMRAHSIDGAEIIDLSSGLSKIDIQGPLASVILPKVIADPFLSRLQRFSFFDTTFNGGRLRISRSGYTGEGGYELYFANETAPALWRALLDAGREDGIAPAGLGARDSLRLEACYSLYGHELTDEITPVEAGIGWIINSDSDYIGRSVAEPQKRAGAPRMMVCFELTGKGIPREGCRILKDGVDVGYATSAGFSPTFRKGIGMALVRAGSLNAGESIDVIIRDRAVSAIVAKRPLYPYHG